MSHDLVAEQDAAFALVEKLADALAEAAVPVWHIGDGYGGWVKMCLDEASERRGLPLREPVQRMASTKRVIPQRLRKAVLERDAYRCQVCETWKDLTLDHIIPESKGGEDTLENLRTLCRSHNSQKGARI